MQGFWYRRPSLFAYVNVVLDWKIFQRSSFHHSKVLNRIVVKICTISYEHVDIKAAISNGIFVFATFEANQCSHSPHNYSQMIIFVLLT
jgi:hypothetical protein